MVTLLLATIVPRHRLLPVVGRLAGTSLSAEIHSSGYDSAGVVEHNHDLVWAVDDISGNRVGDDSMPGKPPGNE